nr:hypothetical protein [uncultured Celeribacter sp.]
MLGIKDTESRQTVKLTLYNRTEILRVRYTDVLVVKTKPPTYLFVHLSISKSQRQKPDQCALTCGAPAQICLKIFCLASRPSHPSERPGQSVWRPSRAVCAAGEGGSSPSDQNPQAIFARNPHFFESFSGKPYFMGFRADVFVSFAQLHDRRMTGEPVICPLNGQKWYKNP